MTMVLRGFGLCSALAENGGASMRVSTIPHIECVPRSLRRKIGTLSQLMYSATMAAIHHNELPVPCPMIVGTAFGEIDTGIDFLVDLHDTRGTMLRPTWIQNCVHVSSSGYLGILLGNQGPTMTISHGKLTAEASLDVLITLLEWQQSPLGLMIVGDLFNPAWRDRLGQPELHHDSYQALWTEDYFEGAAALIVGGEKSSDYDGKHWRIQGGVHRFPRTCSEEFQSYLVETIGPLPQNTEISTRKYALFDEMLPGSWLDHKNNQIGITVLGTGFGTSMTGPLDYLVHRLPRTSADSLLFLAREDDEIGYLRLDRLTKESDV